MRYVGLWEEEALPIKGRYMNGSFGWRGGHLNGAGENKFGRF